MLNPLWLHTFKTLIDVGHFTQTAEKLYMTQPGVSQHVKKLEQACGHALIKRENKSFELTEQGRLVYDYAVKVAVEEAALLDNLNFDDPFSGECRLSCSGSLALRLYPQLLELQKQHQGLTIHLEVAPNDKILRDIENGVVDIGVVTHLPSSSLFYSEELGSEPLCLILPKCHEGKIVTAELLVRCGVIQHPDAAHYLSLYFDQCDDPELASLNTQTLPTASYINQLHQILLPVSQGIGFTVLPKSALVSFPHRDQLFIHTPNKIVVEKLYLVHKRNRDLPKRYQGINKVLFN
ncbi:LysR family transcriptional regulator [Vibrio sp. Of7-15]|uniref:LysR family transcriptional regulator n=1 Tax=Vibrio sp. Of7-15 TaxID=2724879 RepID=UPI001EF2B502|nr:LysR family transcriptional regulator [Vibrio sp. Of7-15]MCG7495410.1 LysR family transcriptional regulator [Vibrio sp. Of7-15]